MGMATSCAATNGCPAPRWGLLYAAFRSQPPVSAHLPLILNPNGKGKMSSVTP